MLSFLSPIERPDNLNTPFHFLITEEIEQKVKKITNIFGEFACVNKPALYYQLLFTVHVGIQDYIEYLYNYGCCEINEPYKGFDFFYWPQIVLIDEWVLPDIFTALYESKIFKDCYSDLVNAKNEYLRINMSKNSNLKLISCPSQFLVLVNQMNFDFFKKYHKILAVAN
jgi:hypothetical protein